jgi:sialidase-1
MPTIFLTLLALAAPPETTAVFTAGADGYHTYRIPALIATPKSTLFAFAEARKAGRGDAGNIDLVLKRSTDGGKTWSPQEVLWDDGENTCGNPCPIIDRDTGTIWLLLTHNVGSDQENAITSGKSKTGRTVWVTHSTDDGASWAKPTEITATTKKPEWTWYATGPGAGIQTKSGRLVAPCDHKTKDDIGYSHVIFSDDHGKSWKTGGVAGPGGNECRVVELSDGKLLLNMRNYKPSTSKTRGIAESSDGGLTWSAFKHDDKLIEPICQATLIPIGKEFLFLNPASSKRENLTARLSTDDCRTWPHEKVVFAGPAAYSDAAVLTDGKIVCLFECGEKQPYETISAATISVEWLK